MVYTVYTVDMVYTVGMVYTVDMVDTVDMVIGVVMSQVSKIQNNPTFAVRGVAGQTLEYSVRTVSLWNWPGCCHLQKMNEKSLWNFHKAVKIAMLVSPSKNE